MTLKELRALVNEIPSDHDDDIVVMSKDGEGNGYSPLADYGFGRYEADSTWSGEYYDECATCRNLIYDENSDEECSECGYIPGSKAGVPCISLWPTN